MSEYLNRGFVEETITFSKLGYNLYFSVIVTPANQTDILTMTALSIPNNKTEISGKDINSIIDMHISAA